MAIIKIFICILVIFFVVTIQSFASDFIISGVVIDVKYQKTSSLFSDIEMTIVTFENGLVKVFDTIVKNIYLNKCNEFSLNRRSFKGEIIVKLCNK